MKSHFLFPFIFVIILSAFHQRSFGQNDTLTSRAVPIDTLTKKEKRQLVRQDFKQNSDRLFFRFNNVFANLTTNVAFSTPNDILTITLGLENQLGLPEKRSFIASNLNYRITPKSGIYSQYYGINRSTSFTADKEYIFLRDTIPQGSYALSYFNTQVVSLGYLFTINESPNAFLATYFNVHVMNLNTGVESDVGNISEEIKYLLPLPNFGILVLFNFNKWLHLEGHVGVFAIHLDDFSGNLYDLNVSLIFQPLHWLGFNICYQEFDVEVTFPEKNIDTTVTYNFRGPSLGINLIF